MLSCGRFGDAVGDLRDHRLQSCSEGFFDGLGRAGGVWVDSGSGGTVGVILAVQNGLLSLSLPFARQQRTTEDVFLAFIVK